MTAQFLISTNPAHGYEEVGRVAISSSADIQQAVAHAQQALPAWSALAVQDRIGYFEKFRELVKTHFEEVATLQTKEMGKPLEESRRELKGRLRWLKNRLAAAPQFLAPRTVDRYDTHQVDLHFEPYGVAAVIAPWNFPTSQFLVGMTLQMLVGNTVVFKHSEECPLTSELLASLIRDASFPEGAFQIVYGDGKVGAELLNQEIDLVSFTGSSGVGKAVYKQAAAKFIPALLEMGGSSPGIVFEDADLAATCSSVYAERFSNCGQICCALKRLIVHESVHDEVVAKLKTEIESQVVGDPLDEKTTVGPLVAKRQVDLLDAQVEDARKKGATVVTGGERPTTLSGAYYMPTLITDIPADARVVTEETFGPVLTVTKFSEEEEAVQMANDTPYGLSAFVYTADTARGDRVAANLQSGQVSINGASYFSDHSPFGGYKESGLGRVGSEEGYYSLAQVKVVARPRN